MSNSETQEIPTTLHAKPELPLGTGISGVSTVTVPVVDILATPVSSVDYRFNEDKYLEELLTYISSTYGQHYSLSKIQSTEFIMDAGHGLGFTIGNIIKYAQRYGKKGGYNRADLLKVCHYAIMSLHVHDQYNTENVD